MIGLVVAPLLPVLGLLFLLAAERLEQSHDFTGQARDGGSRIVVDLAHRHAH